MNLQEVGWEGIAPADLALDRNSWQAHVNVVINSGIPQNAGNFLTS
jgi:hypothetical protein